MLCRMGCRRSRACCACVWSVAVLSSTSATRYTQRSTKLSSDRISMLDARVFGLVFGAIARRGSSFIYPSAPSTQYGELSSTAPAAGRVLAALPRPSRRHRRLEDLCAICLTAMDDGSSCLTPCRHAFHDECLELNLRVSLDCPICRQVLKTAAL